MPCDFRVDMVRESGESPIWYAPVPQESMVCMRGCAGRVRDWKTPSAIVERPELLVCRGGGEEKSGVQMFPRHTKRTETGFGGFGSLIVVVGRWFRCRCVGVLVELFGDAPGSAFRSTGTPLVYLLKAVLVSRSYRDYAEGRWGIV